VLAVIYGVSMQRERCFACKTSKMFEKLRAVSVKKFGWGRHHRS